MGSLKPTTLALISKYPRLTILGYSGTFEKCQNGWVQVSGGNKNNQRTQREQLKP